MKRYIALLLAMCMIFALCACSEKESSPTPDPTAETPVYNPVSFKNGNDRITVRSMPLNVLCAGPNCAELMCALGLADKCAGKCMTNHSLGVLSEYKDAYDSIPTLCEGYPSYDEIVNSGCDFIYASEWIFNDTLTPEKLQAKGITVFINEAHDLDALWAEITDLAAIFNVGDEAEIFILSQKESISSLTSALKDVPPCKVLVYDSLIGDLIYTSCGDNIEARYIEAAGGINIFAESDKAWDGVSADKITAANPDWIIIHDYTGSDYASKLEAIKADPVLSQLACVQNEHFIRLSLENIMPGARSADTVLMLAQTMHPDLVK